MATPPENKPNPNQWEDDFFAANKITDEGEKNAIRGRARVLAYDRARRKAEDDAEKAGKPQSKKWYED